MASSGVSLVCDLLGVELEYLRNTAGNGRQMAIEALQRARTDLERIEKQIDQLDTTAGQTPDAREQLQRLHEQVRALKQQIYLNLTAWQRTELARHPQRPYTLDYIERIFTDWSEIHGDRGFSDDPAIVAGMARFHGDEVLIVGQQKGRDVKSRVYRNFGQANPEGYRKALRIMRIAEKFGRPIICLVDTPGAYPGLGAEERGQAEAIAHNLREIAKIEVPIIVIVHGEGGSGGALAIAIGDRILMLENAIYSVISPEGCASIMWRDSSKKDLAAEAMKITAKDCLKLGVVDAIVPEPEGGAHNDTDAAAAMLDQALQMHLGELKELPLCELMKGRYAKFRHMAQFFVE